MAFLHNIAKKFCWKYLNEIHVLYMLMPVSHSQHFLLRRHRTRVNFKTYLRINDNRKFSWSKAYIIIINLK